MRPAIPVSTRSKRSKTRDRLLAAIPIPSSLIDTKSSSPSWCVAIAIVPPPGEYFTALLTRLVNACANRSRSPSMAGTEGSSARAI